MDKKIAGLLGAAAALTTMTGAQANPSQQSAPTAVTSYRDLLEPVPGAVELLKADDARLAAASEEGNVKLAQYYHHHHHHGYRGPRVYVPRPRYHHHHRYYHHHHHHHHHSGFSIRIR